VSDWQHFYGAAGIGAAFAAGCGSAGASPARLTSVLWLRPRWRAATAPSGETELSRHSKHAAAVDGDFDLPVLHTRDATRLLSSTSHDDN